MKSSASPDEPAQARVSDPPSRGGRAWMAPGGLLAGKYRLERKLGKGSMGLVWAATHLALETPVAIKFLTWDVPSDGETVDAQQVSRVEEKEAREDKRARFEREAKAAAQIRSANVVQVFDYGVDRGVPFIVMELLEGEDLNQRLQREGKLTPAATARLVQAISRALQRAHDVGLVHRDLKPGNIFLAKEGDHEVPKVVDFGVVKAMRGEQKLATEGSENTVEGTLIGTPSYMSPEQAMGRADIDHRSDLWSVGVILFQVLTGMKPFPGGNLFEALVRICSDPIPRPSTIAPELPPGTDAFFARALERDVGKRFQSARELERAFYASVSRPSTSIPPEGHPESEPQLRAESPAAPPAPARAVAMPSIPVEEDIVLPVPPRRGWMIGGAAGLVALVGLAVALLRPSAHTTTGAAPVAGGPAPAAQAPTAGTAGASSEALPVAPVATAASPVPSPAAAEPAASAASSAHASSVAPRPIAPIAPTAGAPAPAAHPAAPPASGHKPKRDLGY